MPNRDRSFLDAAMQDPELGGEAPASGSDQDPETRDSNNQNAEQDPRERLAQEARLRSQFGSGVIILPGRAGHAAVPVRGEKGRWSS